jgi:hypothetical protein
MSEAELHIFYNKKERAFFEYQQLCEHNAKVLVITFTEYLQKAPEYSGCIFASKIDPNNHFNSKEVREYFVKMLKEKFNGKLDVSVSIGADYKIRINYDLERRCHKNDKKN